jgi:hypothetical protein
MRCLAFVLGTESVPWPPWTPRARSPPTLSPAHPRLRLKIDFRIMLSSRTGLIRAVCAASCLLSFAARSSAQPLTATLLVDVRDTTGAPLPGVALSVVHLASGVERSATTTAEGLAAVPLLQPGDYTVKASLGGFKQTSVRTFHLEAGARRGFTIVLTPGDIAETVTVSADAVRARAGTGAGGEVYTGQVLMMTPVASRDVGEFAWQAAGAAPPAPGSRLAGEGGTPVNVSGAREASNNFLLDGVDNNDLFLNRVLVTPSLDAVQEFTLLTSTYDAEFGRSAGGQVNVVLKSGGQRLAGSAYEFFRDRSLEARGPFDPTDQPEPFRRRHQFGATLGGPAPWLRGFFFTAVEGVRDRTADTRLARVPTAAERAGDFSASGLTILDPFSGRPLAGNRIPASRIDPTGAAVAALYPLPNRAGDSNYVSSPVAPHDTFQLTVKTDHRVASDSPFFLRYTLARDDRADPFGGPDRGLAGYGTSTLDVAHNLAFGLTQVFRSRVYHDLRVGWNRLARDVFPVNRGVDGFGTLGMRGPALPPDDRGIPGLVIGGLESLGDDVALPVVRGTHTLHVSDSWSLERGTHFFKAGGELRHYRSDGYNHVFARGQLNFLGAFTGNGLADLLLGFPTVTLLAANDNPQALRTTATNLFVQDDWRVTERLTVNYGVRYEFNQPPVDAKDRMAIFDAATGTLRPVGRDGVPRAGVNGDWNNVAPRVGVSVALNDTASLLLRGGYGIYYDASTLIENSALYFNPPYFTFQVFVPGGPVLPTASGPFPSAAGFEPPISANTLAPEFPTALRHQGSVGIDARVRGVDLSARWVGSRGEHLVRKRNLNQPPPGPGLVDERRPIAGFGDILLVEAAGRSVSHALQLRVERPRARGLWLRGAYTWGKSIDDGSAFLASDGNDNTPQWSARPDLERGLSDYDVRHRVVGAVIWEVPSMGRFAIGRDWQVSALVSAQTGRPFTPRVTSDNSNTGNLGGQFGYDRPDEVPPGTAGAVQYGNRAFRTAAPFTFGSAGRNILIGPGSSSVDLAVSKVTRVGGSRRLEARAEIYNLFNRRNLGLPDSFVDRPTFGESVSAGAGRLAQVAARFSF